MKKKQYLAMRKADEKRYRRFRMRINLKRAYDMVPDYVSVF